ncbi:MAG: MmcQ/YjbR family DNA-binding protein [Oscillospiraceae bacterium]|nr:MmcQ/YjbR family DNA-binding protein [Oscillospiraceae bacterium]
MTKEEYIEYCKTIVGASLDNPFEDVEAVVVRHSDTRKWFALIMEVNGRDAVNLKCEPMEADFLRNAYEGVTAGYHMNKTHWNTVYLESDVPREEIENMTMKSFELTMKKVKKKSTSK